MRIIASLTSWNKRIDSAVQTVKSFLAQDHGDFGVELNLDFQNFPNKYKDLPDELVELEMTDNRFDIFWRDTDLKVWQKIYPTIWRHVGQRYILVTGDDDITYPTTYFKEIEENMKDVDWLCTNHDVYTQGQAMAYGFNAIDKFLRHVDMDFIKNVPLDDHGLFWIMKKYNLKRGKKIEHGFEDRQVGYSFRRYWLNDDPSKILAGDYPREQFIKEHAYLHKRGIV